MKRPRHVKALGADSPLPCPATRAYLYRAMTPACRAAFDAYDHTYLGGLGGGWHAAARAFVAAWNARGPTLTETWERLFKGDPHYGALGGGMNDPARHTIKFWKEGLGFTAVANQVGVRRARPTPEAAITAAVDCAIELAKRGKR